jgi:hypothetical protein
MGCAPQNRFAGVVTGKLQLLQRKVQVLLAMTRLPREVPPPAWPTIHSQP